MAISLSLRHSCSARASARLEQAALKLGVEPLLAPSSLTAGSYRVVREQLNGEVHTLIVTTHLAPMYEWGVPTTAYTFVSG